MRLDYVEPAQLTLLEWEWLFKSAAQGGCRPAVVIEEVNSLRWRCFRFPKGLLAVSAQDGVMTIEAVHASRFGFVVRQLRWVLVQLAQHYKCYKAQTFCFDERLAAAMLRVGGKVTAWQFTWDTGSKGAGNGH